VGDFNGDGIPDLAYGVCESTPIGVVVLLGKGDGSFQPPVTSTTPVCVGGLLVGDLNGDGKADLAGLTSDGVMTLTGNGNGTFQVASVLTLTGGWSGALADFNRDGKLDLAFIPDPPSLPAILLGNGDGTLQPPLYFLCLSFPQALAAGDFNRDGKPDLAVTEELNGVSILKNTTR